MTSIFVASTWCYDAFGYQGVIKFEAEHADQSALVLQAWETYQKWHPTRNLFQSGSSVYEKERLGDLRLAELVDETRNSDTDLENLSHRLEQLIAANPGSARKPPAAELRTFVKNGTEAKKAAMAQSAFDELLHAEQAGESLPCLLELAGTFLRKHGDSRHTDDVRKRQSEYLCRLDEKDIEPARKHVLDRPLDFASGRLLFIDYLDKRPAGKFADEARNAIHSIEEDWDKHAFRGVRDHYYNHTADITGLVHQCRAYLAAHREGKFVATANELLRWSERVSVYGEYRVVLRSGHFSKKVARLLSRGPDLSVELEVGGVRYGPSNIVANNYDPEWNYEFPRRIRWKIGDPVRIIVSDHDYLKRTVVDIVSEESEPLALSLLRGEVTARDGRITFESDFNIPDVPALE